MRNVGAKLVVILTLVPLLLADSDPQLAIGRKAIADRTGCYLVDYSFVETETLKPGYVRDDEVYDTNVGKSTKEWIYAEHISSTRIRLQHVLMLADLSGKVRQETLLKHTGEDWEFNAPFLYDFAGPLTWNVKDLKATPGLWTRRVTSLDDGLRYQCAAAWKPNTEYADWSCKGLAPIPGRETRDMQRRDYNVLDRTSRIVVYGNSWLERASNTKIKDESGTKTPIVKELGKTWYVRLPDNQCSAAQDFAKPRTAFWKIVREAWDQVLTGDGTFVENAVSGDQPSRYEQIMDLEEGYLKKDLSNPTVAKQAREEVLRRINANRKH